jgi:hypothetical protein
VDPGDIVVLDERNVWIEVGPLKTELKLGASVPARLVFARYEVPFTLHVLEKGRDTPIDKALNPTVSQTKETSRLC